MRRSFVWNGKKWQDASKYHASKPRPHARFPTVIHDHTDYQSMATGERITSRSQHREHLKMHGLREVGDEKPGFMQERDKMRQHGLSQKEIEAEEKASRERNTPKDVKFEWMDVDG